MDKRMEKILEDMENNALGLDDTFQFKCRACGKCCKNRHDILLTTRDLYNIAKHLGSSMEYVIKKYCDAYIGHSSRIPVVRLMPVGAERSCPFLRGKRCAVHSAKPAVCAMYPLGRGYEVETPEGGAATPNKFEPTYFFQPDACGNRNHTHTVRSWLERFGIPVEDEFYSLWTGATMGLSETFRKYEETGTEGYLMTAMWQIAFLALYVGYDTSKELAPQFLENTSALRAIPPMAEMKAGIAAGGGALSMIRKSWISMCDSIHQRSGIGEGDARGA